VLVADERREIAHADADALRIAVHEAVISPKVQLLSLAFPRHTTVRDVRNLTAELHRHRIIEFSCDHSLSAYVRVAGRVKITEDPVVAWVMAFGPLMDWPPTRRAPVLEFVLRTKPKGDGLFDKLNQDRDVAHLADVDLGLETDRMSRLFDGTERATRDVLGGPPDALSAAKTTYSFPTSVWDGAGGPELPQGLLEPHGLDVHGAS
jgi:hypothetical protein